MRRPGHEPRRHALLPAQPGDQSRTQPPGAAPEGLLFPRVYPSTEPAQNVQAFLRFKGLEGRFAPAFDGLEDIWSTLAEAPGLAVFLPHTRLEAREAGLLAGCRRPVLETPPLAALPLALAGFLGLCAPDGTSREGASPTGVCRVFAPAAPDGHVANRPSCPRAFAPDGPDDRAEGLLPCPPGFPWEGLTATTDVSGVKVCPLTGGLLPLRLTNATDTVFLRDQADPTGHLGLVLFAAVPGEPARAIGFHPLPERLEPGDW